MQTTLGELRLEANPKKNGLRPPRDYPQSGTTYWHLATNSTY